MKHTIIGTVEAVLFVPHGSEITALRQDAIQVTLEGVVGDRHAGLTLESGSRYPQYPRGTVIRNTRQLSLVSAEELAEVAAALGVPQVTAEALGANVLLSGIPALTRLPPGTRLYFAGDVTLVVEGENHPCTVAGSAVQRDYPDVERLTTRFPDAAMGKRGVVAWVERAGRIAAGDSVRVEVPQQVMYRVTPD